MRIAFGKHKGENWEDAPLGYLQWCLTQDWIKENVRKEITRILDTKSKVTFDFSSLSPEQMLAGAEIIAGKNVLITGPAGCGKSFIIKQMRGAAIICPTGIAAINAGGVTYHSLFRIKPGDPLYRVQNPDIVSKVIVLDEIFYVPPPLLDSVLASIDLRGKQVIMTGDPYQLDPILTAADDYDEKDFSEEELFAIKNIADSNLTLFQVLEKHGIEFTKVTLSKSERHRTDPKFEIALSRVRVGVKDKSVVEFLNTKVQVKPPKESIILCFRKHVARAYNDTYLETFKETKTYAANYFDNVAQDKQNEPWYESFKKKMRKPPLPITLAVGVQVVFTYNDRAAGFVNGDLGKVVYLGDDWVQINILRTDRDVDLRQEKVVKGKNYLGWNNFGILVAKAMTIHKSQGCTITGNVHVHVDPHLAKTWRGAIYTAISRVGTLAQLTLSYKIGLPHISQHKNKYIVQ